MGEQQTERVTFVQRAALRKLRKMAGRGEGEALAPEDWELLWRMHEHGTGRVLQHLFLLLPRSPRCGVCAAPFEGPGRILTRALGYGPSRKNPTVCAACVELAPPGGMTMPTGVLFADLRGFTARFDGADPREASQLLRRFYRCAEDVLFPQAVIDKVIGDEVMALYLPTMKRDVPLDRVPEIMLEHARGLLRAVGYGTAEGPFAEVGLGLDFGDAFVGNIGQRALFDFTAVGDVVNTASRLQHEAGGGQIVVSDRVAAGLSQMPGRPVELELKGKSSAQRAYVAGL